ncbi:MAG: FtsX-like permease family protein, partial [Acidobacteriota bacterium]|nr:FtsX-like permease family protein [Acidobacteriota bacterium]
DRSREPDVRAAVLNGRDAVGRTIVMDGQKIAIEGVAEDARSNDIHNAPLPLIYLPVEQALGGWNVSRVEIRCQANPLAAAQAVRKAIQEIDKAIPIADVSTLAQETDRDLTRELLVGRLAAVFSLLTLLIAALGIYGVLAYQVTQRRAEIGVRMALGATKQRIIRMVFRHAASVLCAGCAVGLVLSFFASSLVRSLLFGKDRLDLLAYGASLALLVLVAIAAGAIPAWRASSIDPAAALRMGWP